MPDPNMDTAYAWAKQLGISPGWYRHDKKNFTPEKIAMFVDMFDRPLIQGRLLSSLSQSEAERRMRGFLSIFLRWWSGCMSMAKVIALETRDGPNKPEYRRMASRRIHRRASKDDIYTDGVKAAVEFKKLRSQYFSFEGIPDTILKRFVNHNDIVKSWEQKVVKHGMDEAIKIGPIMKSINEQKDIKILQVGEKNKGKDSTLALMLAGAMPTLKKEKKETVKGPNSGKRPDKVLLTTSASRKNNTSNTSKSRRRTKQRRRR